MFEFIPLMKMSSQHSAGALKAKIFCERIISVGNLVMKDRKTFLYDDELETLMLLRINRDFMTFIRENHAHTSKQNFKETIILEE